MPWITYLEVMTKHHLLRRCLAEAYISQSPSRNQRHTQSLPEENLIKGQFMEVLEAFKQLIKNSELSKI